MNFPFFINLVLLFHLYQGRKILDSNDGDCSIDEVTPDDWNSQKIFKDIIMDNEVEKTIFSSNYQNIVDIGECEEDSHKCYFTVSLDKTNNKIVIVSNQDLQNIDGDYFRESVKKQIIQKTTLICATGTRDLQFMVTVQDTNGHDPELSQSSYEYVLPMPMPPGINVMQFGDPISANDIDFSNQNIVFTSSLPNLKYSTTLSTDSTAKFPYILQLEFTKITRFAEDTSFTITATDDGSPETRSAKATVVFKVDEKNSEPYIPAFVKPSFLYKYDPTTFTISAEDGEEVTLAEKKEDVKCEIITEDFKPYFDEPVIEDTKIELTLKLQLSDEIIAKKTAVATLSCFVDATPDSTSCADIVISMPEEAIKFPKSTFNAKYSIDSSGNGFVEMDPISIENHGQDIGIEVEDTYSAYFEVKKSDNGWQLSKLKNLDSDLLQSTSLIISMNLMLVDRLLDKASIWLSLPNGETEVSFVSPLFSGTYTYDESGEGNLKIDSTIEINSQYVAVTDEYLVGDYKDNFGVTYKEPNTFEVSKKADLPQKALQNGILSLTLHIDFNLGSTTQSSETAILLYLSEETASTTDSSTTTTTTDPSTTSKPNNNGDCECETTVWIIVVTILVLMFAIYIAATLFYYFKRIRNSRNDTFSPTDDVKPAPHFQKKILRDSFSKPKDVSTRRATGFIRYNPDLDRDSLKSNDRDEELNNNTAANKFVDAPVETFKKIPEDEKDERTIVFAEATTPEVEPETMTLADELKKAVKERESRLI